MLKKRTAIINKTQIENSSFDLIIRMNPKIFSLIIPWKQSPKYNHNYQTKKLFNPLALKAFFITSMEQ